MLVLVIGDLHIPHRVSGIPDKFKKLLVPDKIQSVICTGNLCTKEQFDYLKSLSSDVHVRQVPCRLLWAWRCEICSFCFRLSSLWKHSFWPLRYAACHVRCWCEFYHTYVKIAWLSSTLHDAWNDSHYCPCSRHCRLSRETSMMAHIRKSLSHMHLPARFTILPPQRGTKCRETKVVSLQNWKIGICHGHQIVPWGDIEAMGMMQRQLDVDILVTGHTHKFAVTPHEGKLFINPGSATGAYSGITRCVSECVCMCVCACVCIKCMCIRLTCSRPRDAIIFFQSDQCCWNFWQWGGTVLYSAGSSGRQGYYLRLRVATWGRLSLIQFF